jgi:flavin reductase (DIM6/NTAB) family NADH-FMN oxidoreductase RutF
MDREKIDATEYYQDVVGIMGQRGLLLGSYDAAGKANLMTIGWGAVGRIWGIPVWIVMVRPSRYTYQCIEHSGCFTVNVPEAGMESACALCGSLSGRKVNKFVECKLTEQRAATVLAPTVGECPVVYECQVVHSNDILPEKLSGEILTGAYVDGDYHRVYFGKILLAAAAPDASERLRQQ